MRLQALSISTLFLFHLGCGADSTAVGAPDLTGAVLPDAETVLYVDGVKGNAAPITRAMRDQAGDPSAELIELLPGLSEFVEATGLHSDSFQYMLGSLAGIGTTMESGKPESMRFALAARIDRPLDEALVLGTLEQIADDPEVEFTVSAESHEFGSVIVLQMEEEGVPDLLLHIANDDNGSTLRLASRDEIAAATRTGVAMPEHFTAAQRGISDDSYFWMALVVPEEARTLMRQQPNNPMMGGADRAFHNLQSLVFSGVATDTLSLRLGGMFSTEEEATLVRGFLQGALMPMVMMMFSQSPDGPPPALQTLEFSAAGPQVGISITFTEDDLVKMSGGE